MSPVAAKLLASRAHAVMLDARRKPQCAPAARNFLYLVARYAQRCGEVWLADEAKRFEQGILGN